MKKKLTAMLLIMSMVCTFLPVSAMAAEATGNEAAVVSADGNTTEHATLQGAIDAAQDGETVTLLKDVTTTCTYSGDTRYSIGIKDKSITLDGQGKFTLDVSSTQRGFYVAGGSDAKAPKQVTFQNITIINNKSAGRAIDTRGGAFAFTLDNVTLDTSKGGGNTQPLTIGGDHSGLGDGYLMPVTIKNSTFTAGNAGYGVITFNPVNMTIDTSKISGYAALYFKPDDSSVGSVGSTVKVQGGSELSSYNPHPQGQNDFGTLVFQDGGVKVDVLDATVSAVAASEPWQSIVLFSSHAVKGGSTVTFNEASKVQIVGHEGKFVTEHPTLTNTVTVTGGEYTYDPSQYVDKSKYDVVSSTTPGYQFKVQPITVTDVKPAVGENIIDSDQMDKNMSKEENDAITQAAGTVAADASKLGAVATEEKKNVTQSQKDAAPQALKDANIDTTDKDVNTFVQVYVEVAPITFDADKKVLILNVTPMKRVVAATTDDAADIVVKGEEGNETANAAVVGKAQEINIQELTFSVTLPNGFVTNETDIYVQHKGEEFKNAITDGDNGEKIVTFTTTNGFSPFTYSLTSQAVATIGNQSYTSLQAAVDAVKDGETITLLAAGQSAVVNKEGTFTIDGGVNNYTAALTAGRDIILTDNGNGSYTATKKSAGGGTVVTTYAIDVDAAEGGSVDASHKRAAKNATVTLTVIPDEGYSVDAIIVTDKSGKDIAVTDKGNGKYTFTMPASDVTVKATFAKGDAPSGLPFTDVDANDWYYGPVEYVFNNGIMNGTGDGTTFSPNVPLNRAMIAAVLYNLEGGPAVDNDGAFTDVPSGQWYTDAVNWAASEGIVGGIGDGLYAPNANLTREQMASVLYRYAQYKGIDTSARADLTAFVDGSTVSPWASEVVQWAVAEKLINGAACNTLQPQGIASRAQVATVLMNFCENVAK